MFEFHEKRKLKRLVYSKPTVVVLFIVVLFLLNGVWNVYQKERDTNEKKVMVQRELDELESRERELRKEVNRLSTKRGIEEEILGKFNVARSGEGIIVIVDAPEGDRTSDEQEKKSWWLRILEWF